MQDYNVTSKVAGVLEEYGKDRPSTSKTELMVLALSDRRVDVVPIPSVGESARVHPAAGRDRLSCIPSPDNRHVARRPVSYRRTR